MRVLKYIEVVKRFTRAIKFKDDGYHDEHVEEKKRKGICFNS